MHKYSILSITIPIISVLIIISAFFLTRPQITGLVVAESRQNSNLVNADVILSTKQGEVIPPDAFIQVQLDDKKAQMAIADFIKKTGIDYKVETGELEDFGFYGPGFTGNFTYKLTLADFNINRNIGKGEHKFTTRIIYHGQLLYEKENSIMISE